MTDEQKWKKRFAVFALVRVAGLIVMFVGIGIALSDWIRPGGLAVGWIVATAGLADAIVAPRLLRRHWMRQDEGGA